MRSTKIKMKSQRIADATEQVFALIFDKGDEFVQTLTDWAKEHQISAASFTAIGAFERATLGYFDRDKMDYDQIPINEQVEVLTLAGDIALKDDGTPKVHAHCVVGKRDGTAHGGHVLEALVWPTLEVMLTQAPRRLVRKHDAETGLALIVPGAQSDLR